LYTTRSCTAPRPTTPAGTARLGGCSPVSIGSCVGDRHSCMHVQMLERGPMDDAGLHHGSTAAQTARQLRGNGARLSCSVRHISFIALVATDHSFVHASIACRWKRRSSCGRSSFRVRRRTRRLLLRGRRPHQRESSCLKYDRPSTVHHHVVQATGADDRCM
jgi:hypothetical protein